MAIPILFKVFVYGTLKRGEPNFNVLSAPQNGFSQFLFEAETLNKYPLVIGEVSLCIKLEKFTMNFSFINLSYRNSIQYSFFVRSPRNRYHLRKIIFMYLYVNNFLIFLWFRKLHKG